jgi:hypothetical protein
MITILVVASVGAATPLAFILKAGVTNCILFFTFPVVGLVFVILFSLIIEIDLSKQHRSLQILLQFLNVASFPIFCFLAAWLTFTEGHAHPKLSVSLLPVYVFGVYIMGSLINYFLVGRHRIYGLPAQSVS